MREEARTYFEEQLQYSQEATFPRNTASGKEEIQMRKNYCLPFIVLWVIALIMVAPAPGAAADDKWRTMFP
jgi:hypothetical protein